MVKLILITWSYEDHYPIEEKFISKSKFFKNENIIHIHYNRNNYKDLEVNFESRFGFQYEYILYKIYLTKEFLEKIDFDEFIYSDTDDVFCLKNFSDIKIEDELIFGSEIHKYPNDTNNWDLINQYNEVDVTNKNYLNSGLFYSKKQIFLELLDNLIKNILPKNYKNFGGDQGVYVYHYINNMLPKIKLDFENKYFLNTYLRSPNDFILSENFEIIDKRNNNRPFFIHDNGWNYGSPKFIKHFNIL